MSVSVLWNLSLKQRQRALRHVYVRIRGRALRRGAAGVQYSHCSGSRRSGGDVDVIHIAFTQDGAVSRPTSDAPAASEHC